MNKRIILKTVLVCLGTFLIICSAVIFFFTSRYELDTEQKYRVAVAAADIIPGTVLADDMISYKTIKESALTPHMVQELEDVVGKKVLYPVAKDEYITASMLLSKDQWYTEEDRIIILPMDIEGRLANLISKGSLIDIRILFKDRKVPPQTVLSRIFVEDILDENGLSLGENIGSKKAYAKVVLDQEQRDRVYVAAQYGQLIFELYCDNTQKPSVEDFKVPLEEDGASGNVSSTVPMENASAKEGTP